MKKFFTKIAVFFAILSVGVTTTSCGKEDVKNVIDFIGGGGLDEIIGWITGGESYIYSGTFTVQLWGPSDNAETLIPYSEVGSYDNTTLEVKAAKNGASVSITLPAVPFSDDVKMSEVSLNSLDLKDTVISLGSATTGAGTLTINGKNLSVTGVDIEAKIDAENLVINDLVVFFGEDADQHAVRISFVNGKIVNK